MIKTLIVTGTNSKNPLLTELHNLTLKNKQDYAARHGYDFEAWDTEYNAEGFLQNFQQLKVKLLHYSIVMVVGVDVLFMNHQVEINEDFGFAPLTISREHLNFWPINVDACIWRQCPASQFLIQRLIDDMPEWLKLKWLWQTHLFNLTHSDRLIRDAVQVVEASRLGGTLQRGNSEFQLGQFILHLLDMPIPEKIKHAKQWLPLAGDPKWMQ